MWSDIPNLEESGWNNWTKGIEHEWTSGAILQQYCVRLEMMMDLTLMNLMKMRMKWKWTIILMKHSIFHLRQPKVFFYLTAQTVR